MVAERFNLEVYLVHLPSIPSINVPDFLFSALPSRRIVFLEDIESDGMKNRIDVSSDDARKK